MQGQKIAKKSCSFYGWHFYSIRMSHTFICIIFVCLLAQQWLRAHASCPESGMVKRKMVSLSSSIETVECPSIDSNSHKISVSAHKLDVAVGNNVASNFIRFEANCVHDGSKYINFMKVNLSIRTSEWAQERERDRWIVSAAAWEQQEWKSCHKVHELIRWNKFSCRKSNQTHIDFTALRWHVHTA